MLESASRGRRRLQQHRAGRDLLSLMLVFVEHLPMCQQVCALYFLRHWFPASRIGMLDRGESSPARACSLDGLDFFMVAHQRLCPAEVEHDVNEQSDRL